MKKRKKATKMPAITAHLIAYALGLYHQTPSSTSLPSSSSLSLLSVLSCRRNNIFATSIVSVNSTVTVSSLPVKSLITSREWWKRGIVGTGVAGQLLLNETGLHGRSPPIAVG